MNLLSSINELKEYCLNNSAPENDFEACFMERYRFSRACKLTYGKPVSRLFSLFQDKTKLAEEVVFAGEAILFQDGFNEAHELAQWIDELDPSQGAVFDVCEMTPYVIADHPEDEFGCISSIIENEVDLYAPEARFTDLSETERFDIAYGQFFADNLDFSRHINASQDIKCGQWTENYHAFDDPTCYHFEQSCILVDGVEIPRELHKSISIAGNFHRDGGFSAQGMFRKSLAQMVLVVRTGDELISAPLSEEFRQNIYELVAQLNGE